jgi:hypothetical protein
MDADEKPVRSQPVSFMALIGDGLIVQIDYILDVMPIDTDNALCDVYVQYIITPVTKVPLLWYSIRFA